MSIQSETILEALKKVQGAEILLSITQGLDDVKQGKVSPIESLWDELKSTYSKTEKESINDQELIEILKETMDKQ
ncbi:hypothetical protein [Sulfuricurvum sp.]|uniref:hypothetical protein n=1 Tax=Sulfuricurvum sp. TaxID=2025608 RepID=UPI00260A0CE1|nr:hypothetical protein [Sulfuricurvum sp.]MDD2781176.1 hypothetical protein [Sulfuricurvum sp.]